MSELLEIIKGRKSVRTFDGRQLTEEDREKLERYTETITNPFGIPVQFVFLDAEEYRLSSPVISGEKLYIAGKVEKKPYADVVSDTPLKSWYYMPGHSESGRHGSGAP